MYSLFRPADDGGDKAIKDFPTNNSCDSINAHCTRFSAEPKLERRSFWPSVKKKSLVDRRTAVGDQSNSSDVTLVSTFINIRLHLNFKTHTVKYKNVSQSAVFPDVTTTQIYFIQIKNSECFFFRIAWN